MNKRQPIAWSLKDTPYTECFASMKQIYHLNSRMIFDITKALDDYVDAIHFSQRNTGRNPFDMALLVNCGNHLNIEAGIIVPPKRKVLPVTYDRVTLVDLISSSQGLTMHINALQNIVIDPAPIYEIGSRYALK